MIMQKKNATTHAVNPVVTDEVPNNAPNIVPIASQTEIFSTK